MLASRTTKDIQGILLGVTIAKASAKAGAFAMGTSGERTPIETSAANAIGVRRQGARTGTCSEHATQAHLQSKYSPWLFQAEANSV